MQISPQLGPGERGAFEPANRGLLRQLDDLLVGVPLYPQNIDKCGAGSTERPKLLPSFQKPEEYKII